MGINIQNMNDAVDDSNTNEESPNESDHNLQSYREDVQTFPDGRQIIQYFIEDGPPATIMEVNSNEYTEKTESMSIAGGDVSASRLSPFNKDGYYKYPVPIVGDMHRQTVKNAPRKKLVPGALAKQTNEQEDGSAEEMEVENEY